VMVMMMVMVMVMMMVMVMVMVMVNQMSRTANMFTIDIQQNVFYWNFEQN